MLLEIRFEVKYFNVRQKSNLSVLVEFERDVYHTSVVKKRNNTVICLVKRDAFTRLCCCQFSLGSMFVNPEQLPIIYFCG